MIRWIHQIAGLAGGVLAMTLSAVAGERVLFLGDSITYEGDWTTRVESALRETPRFADAEIVNLGLASETVSGLSETGHAGGSFPRPCLHERLDRVLSAYKPTLVIACYGMNDGIYQPKSADTDAAFSTGIRKLHDAVTARGAEIVHVTPPLFRADEAVAPPYDQVLDGFASQLGALATGGWKVVDIRPGLREAVASAKKENPGFVYAKDGVHPVPMGHGFIAEDICKGLWKSLNLPGKPAIREGEALRILRQRADLLKLAWLTLTKHTRPGVPTGLPMPEAEKSAAGLLSAYKTACQQKTEILTNPSGF